MPVLQSPPQLSVHMQKQSGRLMLCFPMSRRMCFPFVLQEMPHFLPERMQKQKNATPKLPNCSRKTRQFSPLWVLPVLPPESLQTLQRHSLLRHHLQTGLRVF